METTAAWLLIPSSGRKAAGYYQRDNWFPLKDVCFSIRTTDCSFNYIARLFDVVGAWPRIDPLRLFAENGILKEIFNRNVNSKVVSALSEISKSTRWEKWTLIKLCFIQHPLIQKCCFFLHLRIVGNLVTPEQNCSLKRFIIMSLITSHTKFEQRWKPSS